MIKKDYKAPKMVEINLAGESILAGSGEAKSMNVQNIWEDSEDEVEWN